VVFGFGRADLEQVSAAEAISLSPGAPGSGSSVLVDVREPWEFEAGHAPQAINLPMSQLDARLDELSREDTILVICHTGQRSLSVTGRLDHAGFSAVNVIGGMLEWVAAGGALVASDDRTPHV